MKKYLLVNLTILFTAAFLWAAEATTVEPSIDIEAEGKMSWGIDLGTGDKITAQHGFKNEASWNVKFPLIKKGNMTSTKSDVPVYGEVVLKDITLNVQSKNKEGGKFLLDGSVGGLEAKMVFYGAYLTAYGAPDFRANYAQLWVPIIKGDRYGAGSVRFNPGFDGGGTKVGYKNDDFMGLDVGLKFGSNGAWDSANGDGQDNYYWKYFDGNTKIGDGETVIGYNPLLAATGSYPPPGKYLCYKNNGKDPGAHSKYGMGLDFSMKPLDDMLALGFTVNSTFGKDYGASEDIDFGFEVTSTPIEALKLKFGFDGGKSYKEGSKFKWDTIFTAGYKWVTGGVYASSAGTKMGGGNKADLYVFTKFETKSDTEDPSNLLEGLNATAYIGLNKLLTYKEDNVSKFPLLFALGADYRLRLNDSMWIKPFGDLYVETNHFDQNASGDTVSNVGLAYAIGVTYSPVEKVEVEASWEQGSLNEGMYGGYASGRLIEGTVTGNKARHHNGLFVLSLKVEY